MNLLLISNSTNYGEKYLAWPQKYIQEFLQKHEVKDVLFVPYAGVNLTDGELDKSFDLYEQKVNEVFNQLGAEIHSVHREKNPVDAVKKAQCIAVGGGNTFYLTYMLHKLNLMEAIREKALSGTPYMGWSAGSNIACPSIMTTNDMPIIEPKSFSALNLVPFQINPHYLDANPEGHGGETRQQRIEEFLKVNQDKIVVGLREACLLLLENEEIKLEGSRNLRVFYYNTEPKEYEKGSNIQFLLGKIA